VKQSPTCKVTKEFSSGLCRKVCKEKCGVSNRRVFQYRFAIVQGPSILLEVETTQEVITACVIKRNIIVEYESG
jgi:hypothetical protein